MPAEVAAVVFDLDGVIVDNEPVWADAKRELTLAAGGRWHDEAGDAMLGMSGPEWSEYMRDELGVALPAEEIGERVIEGVLRRIESGLRLIPGAADAVVRLAARWPLGLASSSDRPVIDAVLAAAGLTRFFAVTVSSGEVGRGKPAPDVYLAAAERLGADPQATVAVEDSPNGIRSARAAGMGTIAIPNPGTHVPPDVLATADVVLGSIADLDAAQVAAALA